MSTELNINVQPELDPTLEQILEPLVIQRQELSAQIAELEEKKKKLGKEIVEQMLAAGEPELRVGDFKVAIKTKPTTTIDEIKLVEAGVSIDTIKAAKVTNHSDPFVDVRKAGKKS